MTVEKGINEEMMFGFPSQPINLFRLKDMTF